MAHINPQLRLKVRHFTCNSPNERKSRLAFVKDLVAKTSSVSTGKGEAYERIYRGEISGKVYIALADDHGEVNEIFSYRRD